MTKTIRPLLLLLVSITAAGCTTLQRHYDRLRYGDNPYAEAPFYARYLNPDDPRDRQIQQLIDVLRDHPRSAAAHNELGALLMAKGFPNDSEREYRRSIAADSNFHPAWFNLALVQAAKGNETGASRALRRTVALKPGHAEAHFQLGLIYEKRGRVEEAVDHYARAFRFNRALLNVRHNPRIVDTRLTEQALLKLYPTEHARESARFQPTPADYIQPESQRAPSEQPAASEIVTPAEPVTESSQQKPPPPPLQ